MNKLLLTVAIGSLLLMLWASWSFFHDDLSRDSLFTHAAVLTVVWFVTATWWNYRRN